MRLLTEEEIVKEASKDSTYCQLSVDIGLWASKEQDTRTLKAVGEWLNKDVNIRGNKWAVIGRLQWLIEILKRGEMPEEG